MAITAAQIEQTFQTNTELAKKVAAILGGQFDETLDEYASVRQLYSYSDIPYMRLLAANEELSDFGCFGVEGIYPDPPNSHADIMYLNTGDTYSSTIVFDLNTAEFVIGCWGDFEEQAQADYDEDSEEY